MWLKDILIFWRAKQKENQIKSIIVSESEFKPRLFNVVMKAKPFLSQSQAALAFVVTSDLAPVIRAAINGSRTDGLHSWEFFLEEPIFQFQH